MQKSQNNSPYSTILSFRNYDLTQARNKFNETLSNFKNNINEIKNKVTKVKPKANPVKHFTIWLNSFENVLKELENQITKLINDFDLDYKIDCNRLNGWINYFITTILEKELPPNLINNLEYEFQHNLNYNLNQSISQAKKAMNDLKNNIENNNVETSHNINSEINKKIMNHIKISNLLDNRIIKTTFSDLKIAIHIQSDELSIGIENIYCRTIQQVNYLKNNLKVLVDNLNCKSNKSQNNDDVNNDAYNRFIKCMKEFLNQISTANRDLHGLANVLVNENQGTDNINLNTSRQNISEAPTRKNTYSLGQENYAQSTHNRQIEELQNENKILKEEVRNLKKLQNVNKDLGEKVQTLEKLFNSTNSRIHELENENKSLRKEAAKQIVLQTENESLKKKVQNFNQLPNLYNDLREKSQTLENQLKLTNSKNNDLENENKFLRKEAAKYQSALDDAKNFRISDNDPNNISQLTRDIEGLKDLLENFCTLKKVNINYTAFKDLLKKYSCSSTGEKPSRYLVKGILQRHVIDIVIENANKYLQIDDENEQFLEANENEKEQSLETILISTTKKLIKYIDLFSKNRIGKDEVTKSAPIKLRQLIYAVLENRGFSNEGEHPFIIELRNLIMENLNKYRTINNPQKIDEINSIVTKLIHHIISIFCFRRNIQESIVEYKWFKNTDKFDPEFMDCSVDEDNLDKIMVDICYFPLIGTNLEHDEKYQVITRASIVQTDVNSNN
ncbi:hypothetical protein F8M41_016335 [Gigaspora margarita]|uniref:Uncharacterized protein n=1 Tax=Gigaspora margarita TaxID=4874 RepID=A0A8H4EMT6_GIGMA|nr:hypothetical protein F8M41_016335 [Gigaspora margarita]